MSDTSADSSFNSSLGGANWKKDQELERVVQYILQLRDPEKREQALQELSKKRESFLNLAPLLWHSIGTVAIL